MIRKFINVYFSCLLLGYYIYPNGSITSLFIDPEQEQY